MNKNKVFKRKNIFKCFFRKAIFYLLFTASLSALFLALPLKAYATYTPQSIITTDDVIAEDINKMIVYPHLGTPVFIEPGQQFTAELASPKSYGTGGWTSWIENEYKRWDCRVDKVEYGEKNIYLDMRAGYRITITVPDDVSPELCTLVIQHGDDITLRSPLSVSIVPDLDASFYACGITDTHMGKYYNDNGGLLIERISKALTIGGARFFFHTGDISLAPDCSRAYGIENNLVAAVIKGRVPFIVAEGNHEYDKYVEPIPSNTSGTRLGEFDFVNFDRFFGIRSQIIKMGSFAVVKHGYGSYWGDFPLRDALTAKWNALTEVSYRLLLQHTNQHNASSPMFQTSNPPHDPMPSPYPDLMIKGHDHLWWVNQRDPYYILSIGGGPDWVKSKGEAAMFNFNYEDGKWSCPQAVPTFNRYRNSIVFTRQVAGVDESTLRDSFANPNNGTAVNNTCTIVNDTNFNFYDGRERFVMAPGSYTVDGGTVLSEYLSSDGNKTIVLVKVDIPAKGTKIISISPDSPVPTIEPTPSDSQTPADTPAPSDDPSPAEGASEDPAYTHDPMQSIPDNIQSPDDKNNEPDSDNDNSDQDITDKPETMDRDKTLFLLLIFLSGLTILLFLYKVRENKNKTDVPL